MKTRMMGGKGGYGGISTMNQDQRGPRYAPHRNVTLYQNYTDDRTEVSCRDCAQWWFHPRGDRQNTPPLCQRKEAEGWPSIGDVPANTAVEPFIDENGDFRYRLATTWGQQNVASSTGKEDTSG